MTNKPKNSGSDIRTWLLVALVLIGVFIAYQMYSAQQAEQERRDRQNSLYCFLNDNPIYCG